MYKTEPIGVISFEDLHIRHLNLIIDLKNKEFNNWLYKMAIINTFEDLKVFLINLEKNKNKCVIAIQNKKVIGFVHTYPINSQKTCLMIDEPQIFDNEIKNSNRDLILDLVKKAISLNDSKLSNWIISSNINNKVLISISRELGFQPTNEVILWQKPIKDITKSNNHGSSLTENFKRIDKSNIKAVLNFVRSNESILIRSLFNFVQKDIEKRNDKYSGFIQASEEIILTILKDINYKSKTVYSLLTSLCWDERLKINLKNLLDNIVIEKNELIFKTCSDNKNLNKFLKDLQFNEIQIELILIKNSMIRTQKNVRTQNKPLDSIFNKLNPQGNVFPSPTP